MISNRYRFLFLIVVFAFWYSATPVRADSEPVPPRSEREALDTCRSFIQSVERKGVQESFSDFRPLFHIRGAEISALRGAVGSQVAAVRPMYSPPLEMDVLREERLGRSLLRFEIAEVFLQDVVLWSCTFFRPVDHWLINEIAVTVDTDAVFR